MPGSELKLVCALVCDSDPDATSRNLTVPAPTGPRMAIQYLVPAVMLVAEMTAEFHAPFTGLVIVICVRRVPGVLEPVLVYRPTMTCVAALLLSI